MASISRGLQKNSLADTFHAWAEETAEAIQAARVDEQTEAAFSSLKPDLEVWDEELSERVEEQLEDSPNTHWTKPVDQLASEVVVEHYEGAG